MDLESRPGPKDEMPGPQALPALSLSSRRIRRSLGDDASSVGQYCASGTMHVFSVCTAGT